MRKQSDGLILIDIVDDAEEAFEQSFLQKVGHQVVVCHGPEHGTVCPLLAHHGCEKVEGAHGIVFALDLDRPQHRAILRRYREVTRPDLPLRVVIRPDQAETYADELAGFDVWTHMPNAGQLDGFAAEVEAADRYA